MPTTYANVDEFLAGLDPIKRAQVKQIRDYVLNAAPALQENIKWNAPNYVFANQDRITFNVNNKQGLVKLVFHMGAARAENKKAEPILPDPSPSIEWASDIRGYLTFTSLDDVIQKETMIYTTVHDWLTLPA